MIRYCLCICLHTNTKEITDWLFHSFFIGYIKKIINNVNVLVNNLILKFVEDDVVLSLNVKSAELYTVGMHWERSFVDIQEPELVLRRLLDLQDLTVCLDKRNASGKIDTYQVIFFWLAFAIIFFPFNHCTIMEGN